MTYDIFSKTAPAMPKPDRGTNFIKFILSKASKYMQEPLVPMCIPALAAHLSEVSFTYSDNKNYEICGQMGHLIGPSGIKDMQEPLYPTFNRSQFTTDFTFKHFCLVAAEELLQVAGRIG